MPKAAVLLSTFNGETWLPDFLQSITNQTIHFTLVWRDDGSIDASTDIVRHFKAIDLLEAEHSKSGKNLGPCASFGNLLEFAIKNTEATHFFFADQDDLWEEDKLERMLCEFPDDSELKPKLAHHDLRVVDQFGVLIADSLWKYMGLQHDARRLQDFLTRNSVTGCAMVINRQLAEQAVPIPPDANMHDWWIALIASVTGNVCSVDMKLVSYRQHGGNALGAKNAWAGLNPFTNWLAGWRRGNKEYRSLFAQANLLRSHLQKLETNTKDAENLIEEFIDLPKKPIAQRLCVAHRMGLRRNSPLFWLVGMIRIAITRVD